MFVLEWILSFFTWLCPPKAGPTSALTSSLIITTYNWPEALRLVLESVEHQTVLPVEVIIADDGSKPETAAMIKSYKESSRLTIIHSWQPDEGFRPALARNKAIAKATGEYIIIVDGDMLLHQEFIADHLAFAREGAFVQGKRILLKKGETRAGCRWSWKNRNPFLSALWSGRCYFRKLYGIKSCNMGFFRKDVLRVNGFNEDFVGWGREDSEFAARLLHSGVIRRDLQFAATAYHLYHPECSRAMLGKNHTLYLETLGQKKTFCENGINKWMPDSSNFSK